MGNQLCGAHPFLDHQMQFMSQNLIVKCNKSQIRYAKANSSKPLINGYSKIYICQTEKTLLYEGQMKNSKFHGFGKLYQGNKMVYEGEFKDNLFEGWGTTEEYTGQFRGGKFDGYGVFMRFQDEKKEMVNLYYEGYFFDGHYSGMGVLIKDVKLPVQRIKQIHNSEGMVDYLLESIENGNTITSKYGAKQVYIGQFANGFKHGMGRLFKDNRQYSGQFLGGVHHEHGTNINANEQKPKKDKKIACFKAGIK